MGKDAEASVLASVGLMCMGAWDLVMNHRTGGAFAVIAGLVLFVVTLILVVTDARRGNQDDGPVDPPSED